MLTRLLARLKKAKSGSKSISIPSVEYQFSQSDFDSGYFNGRNKISVQQPVQHWPKVTLKDQSN